MKTKEKQQKLIEYIQGEIPEILDLKFGCEVIIKNKNFPLVRNLITPIIFGKPNGEFKILDNDDWFSEFDVRENLGRPITLSDVLRVIEKVKPVPDLELFNVELSISKYGTNGRDNCLWNLEKDFNNQSEETINFLYDLLINKV
jgi:hypothetical protein